MWLLDFVTHQITVSNPSNIPIHTMLDAHINFLANLSTVQEPHSYHQASQSLEWVQAMEDELGP